MRLKLFMSALLVGGCASADDAAIVIEENEWALGVLPDTQHYSARCPEVFAAQTQWLADHAERLGLAFVTHLGDLTEDGITSEWQLASDAMATLEGVVPYSVLPGNHDLGVDGDARSRESQLDTWFPEARFSSSLVSSFPAASMANSFHRVDTRRGEALCIMALEFAPRDDVVAWADAQLASAPECFTVFTTHAYLHDSGERYHSREEQAFHPDAYGIADEENVHDGDELYEALVLPHSQIRFVLSGHALGAGVARRTDTRPDGTRVFSMLSNYQERGACGGDGLLRVIAVSDEGIRVQTYSPSEGLILDDEENAFELSFD